MNKTAIQQRRNWIKNICKLNGIDMAEYAPGCFRLNKADFKTIDVFPKSGKVFLFETQSWIEPDNFEKSIEFYFKKVEDKKEYAIDAYALIKKLSLKYMFVCKRHTRNIIEITKNGYVGLVYNIHKKTVQFSDCEEPGEVTDLERFLTFQFNRA